MLTAGKFEKVSEQQYEQDTDSPGTYSNVVLPKRATVGSAGYDIISPKSFILEPGESTKIATGLRVRMEPGWVLLILPKSGLGTKFRSQLDNTCGVIDSDYYFADNEGHIIISMTNDSKSNKTMEVIAGKAFAQAIFLPYGITEDDVAEGKRTGGFGSTGV